MIQYRPYQATACDRIFAEWQGGNTATLLVLPTGTGKTVVAGMTHRRALEQHRRRGLFLAHREQLIHQAADKLARFDLTTAIEMGDHHARKHLPLFGTADVTIATVQTLQNRRLESWDPRSFGVITVDEAHRIRAATYRKILDYFQGYWLLGITATPDRGDRKNLGAVFDSLAYEYPLKDAIADGYLVPLVTARLQTDVDLRQVRTTGGDYNLADLEAAVGPHVEALARALVAECGARPTVVFTPDVGSAEMMADALSQLKMPAACLSGRMSGYDRKETLGDFRCGALQAVCCCDLLTEGWDEPRVQCVAICRPTRKRNRYAQMIGRGTRIHPESGKTDCLIVDFAWETTSEHELCTPVDLFDDSRTDDAVIQIARDLMKQGRERDPQKALDAASEYVQLRHQYQVQLTGRMPHYRKVVYDPVGVGHILGVSIKQGWDFNPDNPATERQLAYLRKLGVTDVEGLSRHGAGKLIDRLRKRQDQGLATIKQVVYLEALGMDQDEARRLDMKTASRAIDDLRRQKRTG